MQRISQNNVLKLGIKIKKLRFEQPLSMNALALTKGGKTAATWSRVENGKCKDVKLSTLIQFAAALEITVDELLKDIDFDYTLDE